MEKIVHLIPYPVSVTYKLRHCNNVKQIYLKIGIQTAIYYFFTTPPALRVVVVATLVRTLIVVGEG